MATEVFDISVTTLTIKELESLCSDLEVKSVQVNELAGGSVEGSRLLQLVSSIRRCVDTLIDQTERCGPHGCFVPPGRAREQEELRHLKCVCSQQRMQLSRLSSSSSSSSRPFFSPGMASSVSCGAADAAAHVLCRRLDAVGSRGVESSLSSHQVAVRALDRALRHTEPRWAQRAAQLARDAAEEEEGTMGKKEIMKQAEKVESAAERMTAEEKTAKRVHRWNALRVELEKELTDLLYLLEPKRKRKEANHLDSSSSSSSSFV